MASANSALTGQKPPVKSPSFNKCSLGVWDKKSNPKPTKDLTTTLNTLNSYNHVMQFCISDWGDAGQNLSTDMCTNIGDPGEWDVYEKIIMNTCRYNWCEQGYSVSGGCNNGCCAIEGATASCARIAFNADPVVCCFNDYECDQTEEKCFQTPEQQLTCDPKYRDLSSLNCRNTIEDYCTGKKLFASQTDWLEMWLENSTIEINSGMELSTTVIPETLYNPVAYVSERGKKYPLPEKQPCLRAIARNVTLGQVCSWDDLQEGEVITSNIDPDGLEWGRELISKVYNKYKAENGKGLLKGINTDGLNRDSSFYNTLWNLCNKIPLLCTNGSEEFPIGILPDLCSDVTTDTLIQNPDTVKWCACHMKTSQYKDYTDKYGVTRECTPMCNRPGVIPSIDSNGERNFCLQSTCIIDNNNINLTNSQIKGGVNFNQICSGCGKNNVNRKFTASSGDKKSGESYTSNGYALTNPAKHIFLTQYYASPYGGGYSRKNFSGNKLVLNVLYTPSYTAEQIKNLKAKPPWETNINMTSTLAPIDQTTYDNWKKSNNIPITSLQGLFGIKDKKNCIGVVNAGFKISKSTNMPPNFLTQKCVILYSSELVDIGSGKKGYNPLIYDPTQQCGTITTENSEVTFQEVTNKIFNETIVSETENKFNSGKGNSQVTSDTCTCIMQDYTLKTINTVVDGSVNFTQECGKSKCYDFAGNLVSCASTSDNPSTYDTVEEIERKTVIELEEEKYSMIFYILFGFCIFLIILWLFTDIRK